MASSPPSNLGHIQQQVPPPSISNNPPRHRSGSESVDFSHPNSTKIDAAAANSKFVEMDDEEYQIQKRLPPRFPVRKNDVYVTRRTNFKAQIARCQKLLDNGYDAIYIHGLGAAVNRAINLSLQLKRRGLGSLDLAINTSTVEVTDDLEPLLDDLESQVRVRNCSAVHIKIFRPDLPVTDY